MKLVLSSLLLASLVSCASRPHYPKTISEAVNSSFRSEDFRKRDQYRHPEQTLKFFDVQPHMTVVEVWPSGGWYTEILAPYLHAKGNLIIADPPSDPRGYTKRRQEWMKKHKDISEKITMTKFLPPDELTIAPAGTVDRVLTFRNVHNWLPTANQELAFKAFYQALKPGGILGVVEHRASKKVFDPKSGYVSQDEVIRLAKKAGLELIEASEINANPKDTTKHPEGVWTLPPALRLGDKDRAKYLEIGESDRMTLKFRKP